MYQDLSRYVIDLKRSSTCYTNVGTVNEEHITSILYSIPKTPSKLEIFFKLKLNNVKISSKSPGYVFQKDFVEMYST